MRLWHEEMISVLPRQQLLSQHRESAALRGNGWKKKHSTVDYVFNHNPALLFLYHMKVISEMEYRGYKVDQKWKDCFYRGKNCECFDKKEITFKENEVLVRKDLEHVTCIYPEHNHEYLFECNNNLLYKIMTEPFKYTSSDKKRFFNFVEYLDAHVR